jgi:hypothetical protein
MQLNRVNKTMMQYGNGAEPGVDPRSPASHAVCVEPIFGRVAYPNLFHTDMAPLKSTAKLRLLITVLQTMKFSSLVTQNSRPT